MPQVRNLQRLLKNMPFLREGDVMNDAAKVVRYVISQDSQRLVTDSCFQSSNPSVRYVTHADYQALEEENQRLSAEREELRGVVIRLRFELAQALK